MVPRTTVSLRLQPKHGSKQTYRTRTRSPPAPLLPMPSPPAPPSLKNAPGFEFIMAGAVPVVICRCCRPFW